MARYTMELREYIAAQSQYTTEHLTQEQKIEKALPHLFDFNFPIYKESYRKEFEKKVVMRFYMREVGFETMGLFKFYLNQWLNLNMPYYNQLFENAAIEYDPLENVHYHDNHHRDQSGKKDTVSNAKSDTDRDYTSDINGHSQTDDNGKSDTKTQDHSKTSTTDNDDHEENSRTIGDDTPQGRLSNTTAYNSNVSTTNSNGNIKKTGSSTTDSNGNVNNTNENHETQTTTTGQKDNTQTNYNQDTTNNQTHSDSEDYTYERQGKMGNVTYAEMVLKQRETFINIEEQIFQKMSAQLFMGIY